MNWEKAHGGTQKDLRTLFITMSVKEISEELYRSMAKNF